MMSRMDRTSPVSGDSRRRRFRIAVVLVSVVVAVVGSVLLAVRASSEKATTVGPTLTLHVQGYPGALVAGPDVLWVALSGDPQKPAGEGRLLHLDLATGARAPVYLGGEVTHLTHAGDRLIASVQHVSQLGQLAALEWRTGDVLTRHWFDRRVDQVVVRGSELWALETRPGALLRLNSETLEPSPALRLSSGRTLGLASGRGYLWVTASDAGEVLRIDPETHAIARVYVGGFPIGIVVAGGSVWFADDARGSVVRLDPRSLRRMGEPIRVGAKPTWLVAAAGSLFVTDKDDGTVVRIDVRSGKRVGRPIRIAAPTSNAPAPSVAPGGQSIWVSSFASSTLDRIDPTAASAGGKVMVRFTHVNDRQQGDRITNGSVAGRGRFTATGAISDQGTVVVYRKVKGSLITFRYVTSSSDGTITFGVKIDTNFGTSRWTITSGTKAYKGLSGKGTERENPTYTVITLTGTVTH
jgi:hypothetical protein